MLRDGLLQGSAVALSGAGAAARTIAGRLQALGATVCDLGAEDLVDDDGAADWARERRPLAALVFVAGETGGQLDLDLDRTLELAWRAARAVAGGALIDGGGGRLLFAGPPAGARHGAAAQAALENLARTLSVEWARFSITTVALAPGPVTSDSELAELVAFLLSPAGAYFSGCRFELGSVAAAREPRS